MPVDVDALEGSWFSKINHVPGGRQVIMAALMTLIVSGMISVVDSFVAVEDRDDPDALPTETLFEASQNLGAALVVLGIPLLAAGASLAFATHPQRRRVWIFSAVAIGVVLLRIVYIPYLFVIGFLLFAVRKSSKVEGPRSRRMASEADDGDDEPDPDDRDDHEPADEDGLPEDPDADIVDADAPPAGDGPVSTKGWLGRRRAGL